MDYQKNKSSHHLHKQSPREVCAHPSPKIKTCRRNFSKLLNIIGMVHQNLLNDVRAVHACEVWSIHVNSVVYGTTIELFFKHLRGFKTWLFQYILGWSFLKVFFNGWGLHRLTKPFFPTKKLSTIWYRCLLCLGQLELVSHTSKLHSWWLRFTRCQIWQTKHTLHFQRC